MSCVATRKDKTKITNKLDKILQEIITEIFKAQINNSNPKMLKTI